MYPYVPYHVPLRAQGVFVFVKKCEMALWLMIRSLIHKDEKKNIVKTMSFVTFAPHFQIHTFSHEHKALAVEKVLEKKIWNLSVSNSNPNVLRCKPLLRKFVY